MAKSVQGIGGEATHSRAYMWVPEGDFSRLRHGAQSEVRIPGPNKIIIPAPRPVIIWARRGLQQLWALMALTESWNEPLGAISEESIAACGCADMTDFRQTWCHRHNRAGFPPNLDVNCYRFRLWDAQCKHDFAEAIFDHLYGEFLP